MIQNKISICDHVSELYLSMSTAHCLKLANITLIADLVQYSEQEMLRILNFGRKSLNELKEVLVNMGLSFGMNIKDIKLALSKEQTQRIEKLIAEHKECKLRCQTIEKRVNELLDSQCFLISELAMMENVRS